MTAESEVKAKGDVLPGLIKSLGTLAADPTASSFNRFEAIELLLRLAMGPRNRLANSIDLDASRHARIVLLTAASFLDQTMQSNGGRARIRLHAASLASLVTKVTGTIPKRRFGCQAAMPFEARQTCWTGAEEAVHTSTALE